MVFKITYYTVDFKYVVVIILILLNILMFYSTMILIYFFGENNPPLQKVYQFKYLWHSIMANLEDNDDIER